MFGRNLDRGHGPSSNSTVPDASPTQRRRLNIDQEVQSRDADTLGWDGSAKRLGNYLVSYVETPITIGVQGDWGTGKSSFINLVVESLGEKRSAPPPRDHDTNKLARDLQHYEAPPDNSGRAANVYVLRFDSWAFAQSDYAADDLFPIYVASVLEAHLAEAGKGEGGGSGLGLGRRLAHVLRAVAVNASAYFGGETASAVTDEAVKTVLPRTIFSPEQTVSEVSSVKREFQGLVDTLLEPTGQPKTYVNRLLIVVDDLDRISPVVAVSITEKIKVFLDVAGVIFVLATDLSIIEQGLERKFGAGAIPANGKSYLDKIVKIQYNVPNIQRMDLAKLMLGYPIFRLACDLEKTTPEDLINLRFFQLFAVFPTIGGNIRNSKRVLLNFEFSHYLLDSSTAGAPDPDAAFRLLAVTIMYQVNHELARAFYNWLANSEREGFAFSTTLRKQFQGSLTIKDLTVKEGTPVDEFLAVLDAQNFPVSEWRGAFTTTTMSPVIEGATSQ